MQHPLFEKHGDRKGARGDDRILLFRGSQLMEAGDEEEQVLIEDKISRFSSLLRYSVEHSKKSNMYSMSKTWDRVRLTKYNNSYSAVGICEKQDKFSCPWRFV